MKVGVAISTVPGREEWVDRAVKAWYDAGVDWVVVNIDRMKNGVAWNKNRGLASLMGADCDHMFLADDDMYPTSQTSWQRYVFADRNHLMLCWGKSRVALRKGGYAFYTWPRGVMLYLTPDVVRKVGGMRTAFRNGHEHVEYSQRIGNALGYNMPFADLDHNAADWFHCEDIRQPGEGIAAHGQRRKQISTVRRTAEDRDWNNRLLGKHARSVDYVEYR